MRLGIDFGGTKIEGALLDSTGEILNRQRVPNPGDYRSAVRAVADLVAKIESDTARRISVIGLAIPGSLSPKTGLVRNANSVWLNGMPFEQDLET